MNSSNVQFWFFWTLFVHFPSVWFAWKHITKERLGIQTLVLATILGPWAIPIVFFLKDPNRCPACNTQLEEPESSLVQKCCECHILVAWVKMLPGQRSCLHCRTWVPRPNTHAGNHITVCPQCTKNLVIDREIMEFLKAKFSNSIDTTIFARSHDIEEVARELNLPPQAVVAQIRRFIICGHDGTQLRPR